MNETRPTLRGYLAEIFSSVFHHGGELAVAAMLVVAAVLVMAMASPLPLLTTLPPVIIAAIFFHSGLAAWRLHRRQSAVIANTRSLVDLDAGEREELEQTLRSRYALQEQRIEERHAATLRDLAAARPPAAVVARDLSRADDDGWPVIETPAPRGTDV